MVEHRKSLPQAVPSSIYNGEKAVKVSSKCYPPEKTGLSFAGSKRPGCAAEWLLTANLSRSKIALFVEILGELTLVPP